MPGWRWIFLDFHPKNTSKKYTCEISRDIGWEALGKMNFEPVTQISIDEDWSALRFRSVDNIKSMTRKKPSVPKAGNEFRKIIEMKG